MIPVPLLVFHLAESFGKEFFEKKSGRLSSASPKILAGGSHSSVNFQPILDCFIPNAKLKYAGSENIKTVRVDTVIFNSHQIKQRNLFGTPGTFLTINQS